MKVEMYNLVRQITGELVIELDASTVEEALRQMGERYGQDFERAVYSRESGLAGGINVLLKGRNIEVFQGIRTPLEPTDVLSIMSGLY